MSAVPCIGPTMWIFTHSWSNRRTKVYLHLIACFFPLQAFWSCRVILVARFPSPITDAQRRSIFPVMHAGEIIPATHIEIVESAEGVHFILLLVVSIEKQKVSMQRKGKHCNAQSIHSIARTQIQRLYLLCTVVLLDCEQ